MSRLRDPRTEFTENGKPKMTFACNDLNVLLSPQEWLFRQRGYDPDRNLNYETLLTLANGYMGIRGSLEEGAHPQHPGTFIAGVFDTSEAEAKTIVNVTNWLPLRIHACHGPLAVDACELLSFERVLDMGKALLFRKTAFRDRNGRETLLEGYRFLSRADPHCAAGVYYVTPLNWEGSMGVESIIDGTVTNSAFDPRSRVKHLRLVENSRLQSSGARSGNAGYLEMATRDRDTRIGTAAAVEISIEGGGEAAAVFERLSAFGEQCVDYREVEAREGCTYRVEKYVTVYTSRDVEKRRVKEAAGEALERLLSSGMAVELERHVESCRQLWEVSDIRIKGDREADRSLRFNIFHLVSTYTGEDPDVNIGAKALHGEGYKGQAFWDTEIYLFPFFLYTRPEAAKALLMYRCNRLDTARDNAALNGCRGAQFPWNSADTGAEESVKWATTIAGDRIRFRAETQLHITAAVAFAVWQYVRVTGDGDFMLKFGAEILLETARFWAGRSIYNEELDRWEIRDVIAPDEYHLYVDNSFYTNVFARWNIRKALDLVSEWQTFHPRALEKLSRTIGLGSEEIDLWGEVFSKLYVPMDRETGLAEQFEGYFQKKDWIISECDANNMPKWPEGLDIHELAETQIIKQADVVLAMLLLGDEFDDRIKRINYEYYKKRTMHKSTLSASIYSMVGLSLGDDSEAYQCFMRTASTDILDTQGSAGEGIHIAAAGGTWQAAVLGFTGMHVDAEGSLCFKPRLPASWKEMTLRVLFRGSLFEIRMRHDETHVKLLQSEAREATVMVDDKPVTVR